MADYIGKGALLELARDAAKAALAEMADDLVERAKEAAPVYEGPTESRAPHHAPFVLRDSITHDGVSENDDGSGYEVVVYTDESSADYAIVQHENTTWTHKQGGPKYLENPLLDGVIGYEQTLADKARERFGG